MIKGKFPIILPNSSWLNGLIPKVNLFGFGLYLVHGSITVLSLTNQDWSETSHSFTETRKTEILRVGVDATFAPLEYRQNQKIVGFDIDLIEELARRMGFKGVEWVDIDFKGLIPGLLARRFEIVASGMYITPERKEVVDFSDSYYPGGMVVVVQSSNHSIHSPQDIRGRSVAVQTGTKSVAFLKKEFPESRLIEVEKNAEMFGQVESGRADAIVTAAPAARYFVKQRPSLRVLDPALTLEEYGLALRKQDSGLRIAINSALGEMKHSGYYDALVETWFGMAVKPQSKLFDRATFNNQQTG